MLKILFQMDYKRSVCLDGKAGTAWGNECSN